MNEQLVIEELLEIIQNSAKNDVSGFHLAKPTGRLLEEDKTYIEVEYLGITYYARPCMPFGWFAVPSEEWLTKFKDEILIWITFEANNPGHAVWVGIFPRSGKFPQGNYPRTVTFKTELFTFFFDDVAKEFTITKENGQQIKLNEKTVLGKFDSDKEPAVLGNTTVSLLKEILSEIKNITVMSPAGQTGVPLNLSAFEKIEKKVDSILSKSVTLD